MGTLHWECAIGTGFRGDTLLTSGLFGLLFFIQAGWVAISPLTT